MDKLNDLFTRIINKLNKKVDSVEGKQLSTEDFTTAYKNKLDGIPEGGGGGEVNIINTVKVNGTALVPDAQKAVDVKAYNEDNKPEIGGRNLLTGTKEMSNYLGGGSKDTAQYKGLTVVKGDGSTIQEEYIDIGQGPVAVDANTTYTLSFWVRGSGTITSFLYPGAVVKGYNSDGATTTATDGRIGHNLKANWERYWVTWTTFSSLDSSAKIIIAARVCKGDQVWVCGLKLERGEIATDWTPAPEDLEAEIPTSTSQLTNDSGFITQADIPEGAAASNTVPLAPAATGSVGNELAFARGDHVHPIQDYVGMTKADIQTGGDNNWHTPICCAVPNEPSPDYILTRTREDSHCVSYPMRCTSVENVVNASRFSGVLPSEKGGTGTVYKDFSNSQMSSTNFRRDIGAPHNGGFINVSYYNQTNGGLTGDFSSVLKFGGGDVGGYICINPFIVSNGYDVRVGGVGGNENVIWSGSLAFKDDITPAQIALASLYESHSVSAASADMPMSSPSIDGEISPLDQNMIKVYADLCLNPDSGKSVDDVPENLRAYVSAIVEQTLTECKEAKERYKAEMEKREEEERRKAEEEKAKAEAETEKKFETNLVIGNEDEHSPETEDETLTE